MIPKHKLGDSVICIVEKAVQKCTIVGVHQYTDKVEYDIQHVDEISRYDESEVHDNKTAFINYLTDQANLNE